MKRLCMEDNVALVRCGKEVSINILVGSQVLAKKYNIFWKEGFVFATK